MLPYKETDLPNSSFFAASLAYNFGCVVYSTRDVRNNGGGEGGKGGGKGGGGGGFGAGGLGGGEGGGEGGGGDGGWKNVSNLDDIVAKSERNSSLSFL